jgi:methyl-accepting chemotaxis protein
MEKKPRRHLLINQGFQLRFMFLFLAVNAGSALLIGILVYMILSTRLDSLASISPEAASNILTSIIPPFAGVLIGYILVSSFLLWIYLLRVTNKIAGPIYRIRENIRALGRGDLYPGPTLREGDELFESYAALNELREKIMWDLGHLERAIDKLKDASDDEEIKECIRDLEKIGSHYQVPPID